MPTFHDTDENTIYAQIVADLIEKYELTEIPENHLQDLWDDELILAVKPDGSFELGKTHVNQSEARTYRYEHVSVPGLSIVERRYAITESMANGGFETKATVELKSPGTKFYR